MRILLASALLVAGCAPRVAVVDALGGQPLDASVRALGGGRVLVEAAGYESWAGTPGAQVALHPLWQARFAGERIERAAPAPPCAGCPGSRAR